MKTIQVDYKSVTHEKMDFLKERFDEVMERMIADRESLYGKASFLFALIGGIATFTIGKLVDCGFDKHPFWFLFLASESVVLVVLAAVLAWRCLMPSEYACLGGEPAQLLNEQFYSQDLVRMKYGYSVLLQKRMNINRRNNLKSGNTMRIISLSIVASPLAALGLAGCAFALFFW